MARERVGGFRAVGSTAVRLGTLALCSLALGVQAWAVTLLQRPYLQNVRENRATVMWSARENTGAVLEYSPDQEFSFSVPARVRTFPINQTS